MEKRGVIFLVIAIFAVGLFSGYFYSNYKVSMVLEQSYDSAGWNLLNEYRYAEAIQEFNENIDRNKNNFYAYNGLGWSYFYKDFTNQVWTEKYEVWLQNFESSRINFEKAISLNSKEANPYLGLGQLYHWRARGEKQDAEGYYAKAENAFKQALSLEPYNEDANSGLAWNHLWRQISNPDYPIDYSDIAALFQKSLQTSEKWDTYQGLGYAYFKLGEFQKSIDNYKKSLSLNPDNLRAYHQVALISSELGYSSTYEIYNSAIDNFDVAADLEPDNYIAYDSLGWLSNSQGDYKQAIVYFNKSLKLFESSPSYNGLGVSFYELGDYTEALDAFKNSLRIHPDNIFSHQGLGFTYIALDDLENARKSFENMIKVDEKISKAYVMLLYVDFKENKIPEAQELLKTASVFNKGFLSLDTTYPAFAACMKNKEFNIYNSAECVDTNLRLA